METATKQVWKAANNTAWMITMRITVWILFIGLCIQAGTLLYSFFVSLVINPEGAKNLDLGLNLSALYAGSIGYYSMMVLLLICLSGLKAYIFYMVIQIFKKINFVHPFSPEIARLIKVIGYVALGTGVLNLAANSYSEWLIENGFAKYTLEQFTSLYKFLGGGAEFILLGGIIFIISQVFNRGIEIQAENELTV
jgi:hypothetical protein